MYDIYFDRSIRPSIFKLFKGKHFQDLLRFAILKYMHTLHPFKSVPIRVSRNFKIHFDDIYF